MRNYLGEFEELVLLTVGALDEDAYGVSIKTELKKRTGRNPSIGALHSALNRLEAKKYIKSWEGGATAERGGRRKRFYRITNLGKNVLVKANSLRREMLDLIPNLTISSK